jgi:hypothetical protein
MEKAPRMPYLGRWRGLMAEKYSHEDARQLTSKIRSRYEDLYAEREKPPKKSTRLTLERAVLPNLALYQVFLEETGDKYVALKEMEPFVVVADPWFRAAVYSPLIYRMPTPPFFAYRRMFPLVAKWRFPSPYFDFEFAENSNKACTAKVTKCFIFDTLEKRGVPELARLFCAGDDRFFYESLPASIQFERPTSLASGDECCELTLRKIK